MTIHRLVIKDGCLYFPRGGTDDDFRDCPDAPSLLFYRYPAGDVDTIAWPLEEGFRRKLASCLYDERETNSEWERGDTVELPDGTAFDFEQVLMDEPNDDVKEW